MKQTDALPEVFWHGVDPASHVHRDKTPTKEYDTINCLKNI